MLVQWTFEGKKKPRKTKSSMIYHLLHILSPLSLAQYTYPYVYSSIYIWTYQFYPAHILLLLILLFLIEIAMSKSKYEHEKPNNWFFSLVFHQSGEDWIHVGCFLSFLTFEILSRTNDVWANLLLDFKGNRSIISSIILILLVLLFLSSFLRICTRYLSKCYWHCLHLDLIIQFLFRPAEIFVRRKTKSFIKYSCSFLFRTNDK